MIITPGFSVYPGLFIFPGMSLGSTPALDPFLMGGTVSGPNMHDYTGTGYGGLVT